jgi:hypothetical protein
MKMCWVSTVLALVLELHSTSVERPGNIWAVTWLKMLRDLCSWRNTMVQYRVALHV